MEEAGVVGPVLIHMAAIKGLFSLPEVLYQTLINVVLPCILPARRHIDRTVIRRLEVQATLPLRHCNMEVHLTTSNHVLLSRIQFRHIVEVQQEHLRHLIEDILVLVHMVRVVLRDEVTLAIYPGRHRRAAGVEYKYRHAAEHKKMRKQSLMTKTIIRSVLQKICVQRTRRPRKSKNPRL